MLSYHFLNPTLSAQLCLRTLVLYILRLLGLPPKVLEWHAMDIIPFFPLLLPKAKIVLFEDKFRDK